MSDEMRVHPAAENLPMQSDEDFALLVELIAEHGQRRPIVVDEQGRIVDGRNRWKACAVLGIEPITEPLGDRDPWVLSEYENDATRSLTTGQKAMRRALTLATQGKRKDGRWEYGSKVANSETFPNSEAWQKAMGQAGQVIDCAKRAESLTPGEGISTEDRDYYMSLPHQVVFKVDGMTLSRAFNHSADFDAKVAFAEAALWRPLTDRMNDLQQLASDTSRYLPLPTIDAELPKEHRDQLSEIAKNLAATVAEIRKYAKEAK